MHYVSEVGTQRINKLSIKKNNDKKCEHLFRRTSAAVGQKTSLEYVLCVLCVNQNNFSYIFESVSRDFLKIVPI